MNIYMQEFYLSNKYIKYNILIKFVLLNNIHVWQIITNLIKIPYSLISIKEYNVPFNSLNSL